jgi:hypothetical protein
MESAFAMDFTVSDNSGLERGGALFEPECLVIFEPDILTDRITRIPYVEIDGVASGTVFRSVRDGIIFAVVLIVGLMVLAVVNLAGLCILLPAIGGFIFKLIRRDTIMCIFYRGYVKKLERNNMGKKKRDKFTDELIRRISVAQAEARSGERGA